MPSAVYFGNRAAAYLMMGQLEDAITDCQQALKIDPQFVKGYIRAGFCCLQLGLLEEATRYYTQLQDIDFTVCIHYAIL